MEFDIVSIRIILLLSMLGIASYFDIKTRMVPDIIWLIFGGLGTILYIFDYSTVTSYHVISIIMGGFASFMVWRCRLAGIADCFAILAMTVILPVHYEFVMVSIAMLIVSFVIAGFVTLTRYILLKLRRHDISLKQVKPHPFTAYMLGTALLVFLPEILVLF